MGQQGQLSVDDAAAMLRKCCVVMQHLMKRIQRGPVRGISLKLQVRSRACSLRQGMQEACMIVWGMQGHAR